MKQTIVNFETVSFDIYVVLLPTALFVRNCKGMYVCVLVENVLHLNQILSRSAKPFQRCVVTNMYTSNQTLAFTILIWQ